ncbi:MAG: hypothetical protein IPL61_39300 [Myxococcales bacterium]|nr:hypothetical protein [Myxococcales bacterium]
MTSTPVELIGDDQHFGYRLLEIMHDPDEGPVARPFFSGRVVTAAERVAYADFLTARGDVRGEVVALTARLSAEPTAADAPAARARLTALVPQVDPGWWALVREPQHLLNCGEARARHPGVRFAYACPRSWEQLAPTASAGVRHCDGCREDVHRADTIDAAAALARDGRCVAVPAALAETAAYPDGRTMITGRPAHPVQRWSAQLFGPLPEHDDR